MVRLSVLTLIGSIFIFWKTMGSLVVDEYNCLFYVHHVRTLHFLTLKELPMFSTSHQGCLDLAEESPDPASIIFVCYIKQSTAKSRMEDWMVLVTSFIKIKNTISLSVRPSVCTKLICHNVYHSNLLLLWRLQLCVTCNRT